MQPIRTLIVDDEARIRRGIERLVQSCGTAWEVVAVLADGREALDYLHTNGGGIDLLITDVKMPEMDGLSLIKEARRHYAFYPMVISGYDDFTYLQTALREGAVEYMLKPVDRDQFRSRMAEIKERIDSGRQEQHKRGETERQAEKLKPARQTQMLSYITSAGIDISRLGYWVEEFPKGHYLLLYASLDAMPFKTRAYTPKDWEAYTFVLENILAEVVTNHEQQTGLQGWSWRGGNSDFWMLLHEGASLGAGIVTGPVAAVMPTCGESAPKMEAGRDAQEEGLIEAVSEVVPYDMLNEAGMALAEQIRTSIHTYTPFTISVSFGDVVEDLYLLPDVRQQAQSLMHYRLLGGGNRVYRPEQFVGTEGASAAERMPLELIQIAQRLKQAVSQANEEEALGLFRQFFAELEGMPSPVAIRKAVQNLFIHIHSAGLEGSAGAEADAVDEAILRLGQATRLQELRAELDKRMHEVMAGIRAARSDSNRKPVEQAKVWIQAHLGDDITIKRIADQVYMNPTYFCQYFKMQTGDTVLDYVTRERIEKAKTLLVDPSAKLQDISVQVGYQDVKYFSRLFKQWVGCSPSKYRERGIAQHS